MDLKTEIIRRVEELPLDRQRQLLNEIERWSAAGRHGERGAALLPFSGTLDAESAREMTEEIEAGCEAIDPRAW